MREYQWFFAKAVPDLMRNEPKNVGLLLRGADGRFERRIREQPPFLNDQAWAEFLVWMKKWEESFDKYGPKTLHWLQKRKAGEPFYWELGGAHMATNVDFDAMFKELVL